MNLCCFQRFEMADDLDANNAVGDLIAMEQGNPMASYSGRDEPRTK
jgi:hypothetical protein